MPDPADFDTPHDAAFVSLGACRPRLHWSAFDVPLDQARAGKATKLVTTIWNFHRDKDENGIVSPDTLAICRDKDGTFWYRVRKPSVGTTRMTWIAHWNRLELAFKNGVPIIGVLKDVESGSCAPKNIFDCVNPHPDVSGNAMWLQLMPHGDVGCDVMPIDIQQVTGLHVQGLRSLEQVSGRFEVDVREASKMSDAELLARLAVAPRLPARDFVIKPVYRRNPYVVEVVLRRAKGFCENCKQPAPFLRLKDGSPYLEVHHIKTLATHGEDTVENAIALCPNCHRASHYG